MQTFGGRWWALAVLLSCGLARTALGIFLDEDQNFSLRARIYSQASIRTENSQVDTVPSTKAGQLIQHRNYYNPELDAKLSPYTKWMKGTFLDVVAPDDFGFRLAAWGFYDGIYDYGSRQFHNTARLVNSTFPDVLKFNEGHAFILEGPKFNCQRRIGRNRVCVNAAGQGSSISDIFPGAEVQNPHDIYASQHRVNELYLNYTKGPLFVRVGKQSISWGESDTIALLDQNNPFDLTLGAPGFFEDLDEARIPLWTVRTSLTLFDTLGPLSSGFVEAYWVPGQLDVNTGILPVLTASPYSPRGVDPQQTANELSAGVLPVQFVLLDRIPTRSFQNSRYGFRVQAIVARNYTVSAWYYTHFPSAPVPQGLGLTRTNTQFPPVPGTPPEFVQLTTVQTVHDLVSVIGASNTFFLEPLDGIVRMELEYFDNEPGFIPCINLNICKDPSSLDPITQPGSVPRADIFRGELGFDRFFFFRPLNPTNSFVLVTALVGTYNLDETSQKDFRFDGQRKPGTTGRTEDDFVQLNKVEAFGQITVQTDYMHGRLQPRLTVIGSARGTWAVLPTVTYRWTDWLLFGFTYANIGGDYQSLGFFRDRSQVSFRATYQLN